MPVRCGTLQTHLVTVGHGVLSAEELTHLLGGGDIRIVVDVRSIPRSRRNPQFDIAELEQQLPAAGIGYRWEPGLGGFRRRVPGSRNTALRHPSFRAYADYMATSAFHSALGRVLTAARRDRLVVMCAETLWWRCHRRLIADAATILCGAEVSHLGHDGRLTPHRLTEGVRREGHELVYDGAGAGGTSRQAVSHKGGADPHR